jgi:hypothetical protein
MKSSLASGLNTTLWTPLHYQRSNIFIVLCDSEGEIMVTEQAERQRQVSIPKGI